jgi:hypothetical protein
MNRESPFMTFMATALAKPILTARATRIRMRIPPCAPTGHSEGIRKPGSRSGRRKKFSATAAQLQRERANDLQVTSLKAPCKRDLFLFNNEYASIKFKTDKPELRLSKP